MHYEKQTDHKSSKQTRTHTSNKQTDEQSIKKANIHTSEKQTAKTIN